MEKDRVLNEMKKLIGKNKPILKLKKSIQFTDEPKFYQYTAFLNNFPRVSDAPQDNENQGSGLDFDKRIAQIKAMGEAIERFCLGKFRKKDFLKGSVKSLNKNTVDPSKFINYLDINKEDINKHFLDEKRLYWTWGEDYFKKKKTLIPAQLVYVPYEEKEIVLRNPISNGAACASSKNEAIYKGICELIERDAFMIHYLHKIPPKRIRLDSIKNKYLSDLILKFKRYFIEVNLFEITTDIKVPSILCILVDRSGVGPSLSIGTKTDFDIDSAIKGAIFESQHTRTWIRYALVSGKKVKNKNEIKTVQDRGVYWSKTNQLKKLDFILNSDKKINYDSLKRREIKDKKIGAVLKIIKEKNYSLYIKNLTNKKIKERGFYVYKSIILNLHPLFLFENLRYLYGDRIKNFRKDKSNKLNLEPHPFV